MALKTSQSPDICHLNRIIFVAAIVSRDPATSFQKVQKKKTSRWSKRSSIYKTPKGHCSLPEISTGYPSPSYVVWSDNLLLTRHKSEWLVIVIGAVGGVPLPTVNRLLPYVLLLQAPLFTQPFPVYSNLLLQYIIFYIAKFYFLSWCPIFTFVALRIMEYIATVRAGMRPDIIRKSEPRPPARPAGRQQNKTTHPIINTAASQLRIINKQNKENHTVVVNSGRQRMRRTEFGPVTNLL